MPTNQCSLVAYSGAGGSGEAYCHKDFLNQHKSVCKVSMNARGQTVAIQCDGVPCARMRQACEPRGPVVTMGPPLTRTPYSDGIGLPLALWCQNGSQFVGYVTFDFVRHQCATNAAIAASLPPPPAVVAVPRPPVAVAVPRPPLHAPRPAMAIHERECTSACSCGSGCAGGGSSSSDSSSGGECGVRDGRRCTRNGSRRGGGCGCGKASCPRARTTIVPQTHAVVPQAPAIVMQPQPPALVAVAPPQVLNVPLAGGPCMASPELSSCAQIGLGADPADYGLGRGCPLSICPRGGSIFRVTKSLHGYRVGPTGVASTFLHEASVTVNPLQVGGWQGSAKMPEMFVFEGTPFTFSGIERETDEFGAIRYSRVRDHPECGQGDPQYYPYQIRTTDSFLLCPNSFVGRFQPSQRFNPTSSLCFVQPSTEAQQPACDLSNSQWIFVPMNCDFAGGPMRRDDKFYIAMDLQRAGGANFLAWRSDKGNFDLTTMAHASVFSVPSAPIDCRDNGTSTFYYPGLVDYSPAPPPPAPTPAPLPPAPAPLQAARPIVSVQQTVAPAAPKRKSYTWIWVTAALIAAASLAAWALLRKRGMQQQPPRPPVPVS